MVWAFAGRLSLPKRQGAGLHSRCLDAGRFIGPELNFLFDPKVTLKGNLYFVLCALYFVLGTLNPALVAALQIESTSKNKVQSTKHKVESTKYKPLRNPILRILPIVI